MIEVSHAITQSANLISHPALIWVPLLPLAAFLVLIFFGRFFGRLSPMVSIGAIGGSAVATVMMAPEVFAGQWPSVRWKWLSHYDPAWTMGLQVDGLSLLMLAIVTSIGLMIQIYSVSYMRGDERFTRFFAYMSLFCASMLGLVMADHFLLMFMCWEVVGVCSYLLISFWFEKPAAAAAGRKAFMTTKVGDLGLMLAIFILFWVAGDLRFDHLDLIRTELLADNRGFYLTWISGFLLMGAIGKSAQFPLHVWLPDAMEGPTSVSALIHAATMVAAGVYLVARTLVLFTPESLMVVLVLGMITHLFAGSIALTMTDIKRVLAYSTLSQLGFMFVALGIGSMSTAMFHLMTHAYFKALLFLAAGSVIHAAHKQELSELGGLGKVMPWTRAVFLIGAISMAGFPFLSGFWSKDTLLLAAQSDRPVVYWLLIAGAVMTATYIMRLYLRTFHGNAQWSENHRPHESDGWIVFPMVVLAAGALGVGLLGSPVMHHPVLKLLGEHHLHEHIAWDMVAVSGGIFVIAFGLAWQFGLKQRAIPSILRPVYFLAHRKYFIDEIYATLIIKPVKSLAVIFSVIDQKVIDGLVNAAGWLGLWGAHIKAAIDRYFIDGAVNGLAAAAQALGRMGRTLQTGDLTHYLYVVVLGVVALSLLIGV